MTKSQEKNSPENGDFQTVASHYSALSRHYDDWFSKPWPAPAVAQGEAINGLFKAAGLPAQSRVLDLTCGVGTQAYGLALKGHRVTAVDISEGQLEEARKRATDASVEWVLGNAADIAAAVQGPFDAVISFGNSLPLLGSAEAMLASLKQSRDLLASRGRIFVSMRDHTDLRARKPYVTASGSTARGVWLETAEWMPDGVRYKSHIIFVVNQPVHEHIHYPFPPLAALTAEEMLQLMRDAGFAEVTQTAHPAFSFPVFSGVKA